MADAPVSTSTYGRGRATCSAGHERLAQEALLTVEAVLRALVGRAVPAHIRHAHEPALTLLVEIGVVQKGPTVDEIAAEVPDRPLDFALRLRPVRTARARHEAPVTGEAEKLRVAHQCAALEPQVPRDHRFHLIEEQLRGDAAE